MIGLLDGFSRSAMVMALMPQSGDAMLSYVGPAGIGTLGVLVAVMLVVLVGAVGLVLYPVRLILRRTRHSRNERAMNQHEIASSDGA